MRASAATLRFHYLIDLHYSQTNSRRKTAWPKFHYLMDLHYSQTLGSLLVST